MPRCSVILSALLLAMTSATFAGDFKSDLDFLKQYTDVLVLRAPGGQAMLAVSPKLQGRVMTSTADGDQGLSFGWINRDYFADVAKGNVNKHINPYGGEDRFWLGPEGGQFAIFFSPGSAFDFDHWFTPPQIDTEPFEVVSSVGDHATFSREMSLTNFSGTTFKLLVTREVRMLTPDAVWQRLGVEPVSGLKVVAYETDNAVRNTGDADWKKETGLLSIWILGMFNASPKTVVAIPVKGGEGQAVNDDYFGKVPADRLKVVNNVAYFKADANLRSKIGVPPSRVKPVAGSYDPTNKGLTFVQFTFDPQASEYVNSAWKMQDNPYGGDVINSYNDGPTGPGKPQMGKFYELETSSPARELKKGDTLRHVHRTMHLQGDEAQLERVSRAVLGVGLKEIESAFSQ